MFQIPLHALKTFVFENEVTSQSENFEIAISTMATEIEIRHFIDSFKEKNNFFMPMEWKVYDPQILTYRIIDIEKPLSQIYLLSPVIMLKYRQLSFPDSADDSINNSKAESEGKKERTRQRTIRQVIQYVKQWRQIHNTLDKYKNKVNLYDAAKTVGIAKKSLDDYFCQLRLAEEYGFDFQRNLNQKIGVLRSFVRKNRPKGSQSNKHQRLPRKLKIIQECPFMNNTVPEKVVQEKIQQMYLQQQDVQTIMEAQYQPPLATIVQDQMQNRFLSCFNFMIEDPSDPFINLGYFRSSSKKSNSPEPQQYLFF